MVSNRKLKFLSGERVLCYEPDPTKAKVLYDSKVLDVIMNKDSRGKKSYEYLIHFQGWNSSWDRVVGEEFVLKDTPENRQLQKDLAEKSQLQLGAYLYRKERKKHRNKQQSDRPPAASSEDGSSGSPARMDTDEGQEDVMSTTTEDDSSAEEESIHIDLTPVLREHLEKDHQLINEKHKLVKLPADPNVATILENYYKHYATNQICGLNEKQSKYRHFSNQSNKHKPEDIQKNLTLCREVMDGLRVYFDFTINDLLLYKSERGQMQTKQAVFPPIDVKTEIKTECQSPEYHDDCGSNQNGSNQSEAKLLSISRRRTLRSNRSDSLTNGQNTSGVVESSVTPKTAPSIGSSNSDTNGPLAKALSWRLLPDHVFAQQPPPPCLVYGAVHLTRLFVRLPDLLATTNMAENKLKTLLQHLELFIDYLTEHKDWYGEKFYVDKV